MATLSRLLAALAFLAAAATAAAAAQPGPTPGSRAWVELEPEWSRPVGGRVRLVGVEEYGRCSVFVDNGAVQVVAPSGDISWTWRFSKISKYINPREVAVSPECDAIAFVGNASYKYVWIVDRAGTSATIKLASTPASVEFDRDGTHVALGTYAGSQLSYSRNGTLLGERQTPPRWSSADPIDESDDTAKTAVPYYRWRIAVSEDGKRSWFRGEDSIDCLDENGAVLASISAVPGLRGVRVSKDFAQVLVVTEKDLDPVSVERYEVPKPCRP